jgi:hypothetical protein
MAQRDFKRVLGIDPFSRGVGFAVLESPSALVDWGLRSTGRADSVKAARAIETLIDRFQPDILALEDWEAAGSRRCGRIEKLLDRIANQEKERVSVRLISPHQIHGIGPLPQTGTKNGRACLLADRFPEIAPFLPPFRKPWMAEDDRMSIFDALAFAVVVFPKRRVASDPPTAESNMTEVR